MKKAETQKAGTVGSSKWIEVETQGITPNALIRAVHPLEVEVGSCVVRVPVGFDKGLLIEVCQTLLSL